MKKDQVDQIINKHLPYRWKQKHIEYYLGKPNYKFDISAINSNLNDPIRDFILRGGKRLRPVLFLTCLEILGKKPKKYLDFAYVIELIHNGTLVLDDIEDNGLLRRGKRTCHRKFGVDVATNSGMSMHVMPLRIILKNRKDLTNKQIIRLFEIYTDEMINVSFGQALDIYQM